MTYSTQINYLFEVYLAQLINVITVSPYFTILRKLNSLLMFITSYLKKTIKAIFQVKFSRISDY